MSKAPPELGRSISHYTGERVHVFSCFSLSSTLADCHIVNTCVCVALVVHVVTCAGDSDCRERLWGATAREHGGGDIGWEEGDTVAECLRKWKIPVSLAE